MGRSIRIAAVAVATIAPGGDLAALAERRGSTYLAGFRELSRRSDAMIVLGYLGRAAGGIRNAVVISDRGRAVGYHYESKLWADTERPYRDETTSMLPGDGVEVFDTWFGKLAVLICHESGSPELRAGLAKQVDLALTPEPELNLEYPTGDGPPGRDPSAGNLVRSLANTPMSRYSIEVVWPPIASCPGSGGHGISSARQRPEVIPFRAPVKLRRIQT